MKRNLSLVKTLFMYRQTLSDVMCHSLHDFFIMVVLLLFLYVIDNKRKAVVVKLLQSSGYPSDPVKNWKQSVSDETEENEEDEGEGGTGSEDKSDYNYLLSMSLWSLTLEKKEEILKKRDEKVHKLTFLCN